MLVYQRVNVPWRGDFVAITLKSINVGDDIPKPVGCEKCLDIYQALKGTVAVAFCKRWESSQE
jgi:hypothetical protein